MNLSYQHANPSTGGGSYLLRFRNPSQQQTPCVLVDSGVGVDLDSLLGDDEYLAAVLLTHAHLDHYASLADSLRDGAPIYAAEPTASVLENVLTEGEKNYEIGASESAVEAIEPLDGWQTIVPNVEVTPVPAGHAPGAAGFVVRFEDGSRTNHLLFTGDFTRRRVAGYPGFPTELPVEIDALFINVSTTEDFEETLSDSLFTIVERIQAGSSVLATASALTAVHYAYLLGHLGDQLGESIPVRLAGQAAKLYADFGYDVPNVETVPVFDSPDELLERGTVTFAGPEVPSEGSARRLFETIKEDSGATLIQLTGGATNPVKTAACTVYDFEVVNHSSLEIIDEVVEGFDPIHVVAGHGPRRELRNFRGRYDERFVWASDDDREQTLYESGRWSPPPWLSETAVQSIRARDWRSNGTRFGDLVDGEGMPRVVRTDETDLEAEGLRMERFDNRFGGRDSEETIARPEAEASSPDDASAESVASGAESPTSESVISNASASDSAVAESEADAKALGSEAPGSEAPDSGASGSEAPDSDDYPAVDEGESFRLEVLDKLESLESAVTGKQLRARVVDGGEDVTMLRLLNDADFEHGEEITVVVPDGDG